MELNNVFEIQHQIRESSEDLQKYLLDLDSWEKEMKKKEEELKLIQTTSGEEIPPVRNSLYRPRKKSKYKKQKDKVTTPNKGPTSTIDYQAWEKFDAEAELKKIDEETKHSSASETSENEDEFSIQKRKQLALLHKDKGNNFLKHGNYDSAINSYTTGLQLDPENPLLAANRAMAFLKKEQFQAAENDCTLCLAIDPTYVKAYLRRGTARKKLKKFLLAKSDFLKVLELEPHNKQAQTEFKKLSGVPTTDEMTNISDKEVVKTQELWPQFLGNKVVKHTEEPNEEVNNRLPRKENNTCIFPDSCPIFPAKPSSWINDLDSRVQTEILELNENNFVKIVEKNMDSFQVSSSDKIDRSEKTLSTPHLPPIPINSFQFLNDWNAITLYPDLQYKYLKQFPPEKFPIFFKHDMELTIFPKLLETLSTSFIEHGDDIYDYMKYFTDIGRFQTMVMFLSSKEENDLKKLLEYVKTSRRPESEISFILKKYGV